MSTYLDFSVQTRQGFKDWICGMLGEPLITVEVHDTQLDLAINNAVEEWSREAPMEQDYYAVDLEGYIEGEGVLLPSNVAGVFTFNDQTVFSGNGSAVNMLFSIPNMMWNAGLIPNFAMGKGGGWITYELAMQSLKLTKRMTGGGFQFEYNPRNKMLKLTPDAAAENVKGHIVVGCHVIRPEDEMFGEQWVKRMGLAQTKIILGQVREKFTGVQLLGGGNLNTDIKAEGIAERDQLREELLTRETGAWTFFVG